MFRYFADFFVAVYDYREYLKQSVARDLRKRYKRSVLGYFWSMLNPLLMMAILTLVFSSLMRQGIKDYAVFLFCGMLPWNFFNATTMSSLDAIRGNMKIISQIPVPKYIFILSITAANLVDLLLSMLVLFLIMIFLGHPFHLAGFALPMILFPLLLTSVGVSLLLSVSNVFFEDTQHLTNVLLRALYFLCPVIYGREHLPEWLIKWIVLNPMFCIVEFMRDIFYYGKLPIIETYTYNVFGGLLLLSLGLMAFKKADNKFIYFA